MKRSLLVATGVLALAAVSKPLFAAETETPAPIERAAPAAVERAPAPERRARPAQQRQVARQTGGQQQSQASQTSSFTGVQAGGFGGGNAGGGGFADPVCLNSSGGLSNGCTGVPYNQSLNKTSGRVGGVVQWMVPVTQYVMVGVTGDISGGSSSATNSQTNLYASDPLIPNQVTAEQLRSTVTQGTSGSARLKVGVVVPLQYTSIMPYATVGWTHSTITGTFSYSASNYNSVSCFAFNPMCSTIAGSAVSISQSRNGAVFGFGAEMGLSAWGLPGFVLVLDYTRAQFGSFNVNLPVAVGSISGSPCMQSSNSSSSSSYACTTTDVGRFSNVSTNTFSVGLRVKLF